MTAISSGSNDTSYTPRMGLKRRGGGGGVVSVASSRPTKGVYNIVYVVFLLIMHYDSI
jgi:hypothetical protein